MKKTNRTIDENLVPNISDEEKEKTDTGS